jgi:hypothetical protein
MRYRYRSICRFPILIHLDGEIVSIRPNQVFESSVPLEMDILKRIEEDVKATPKPRRGRRSKGDLNG